MNLMEALISAKLGGSGGGGAGGAVSSVNGKTGAVVLTAADLDDSFKDALLACFAHVAWTDEHGQDYYDALEEAIYPSADLVSISVVYTQSGTVYDTDSLDSLRADLVVTATYAGNTERTVTDYTLSGTLTVGTSTITVSYGGKTATFTVTVTERKSDMNQWMDGVPYTDLTVVQNSYVAEANGAIGAYNGWNRTGYVPCNGASAITFPAMPQNQYTPTSNWFYDENNTPVSQFTLSKTEEKTVSVPGTAHYFIISSESAALATCIEDGIVPHA